MSRKEEGSEMEYKVRMYDGNKEGRDEEYCYLMAVYYDPSLQRHITEHRVSIHLSQWSLQSNAPLIGTQT